MRVTVKDRKQDFHEFLSDQRACNEATAWAAKYGYNYEHAWVECDNPEWMMWALYETDCPTLIVEQIALALISEAMHFLRMFCPAPLAHVHVLGEVIAEHSRHHVRALDRGETTDTAAKHLDTHRAHYQKVLEDLPLIEQGRGRTADLKVFARAFRSGHIARRSAFLTALAAYSVLVSANTEAVSASTNGAMSQAAMRQRTCRVIRDCVGDRTLVWEK